jgi:hypothetical protein
MTRFKIYKNLLQAIADKQVRKFALQNFYKSNNDDLSETIDSTSIYDIYDALFSFAWEKTEQGSQYWIDVYHNYQSQISIGSFNGRNVSSNATYMSLLIEHALMKEMTRKINEDILNNVLKL